VRDAGKYDGNLGVVAAIQAVAELHARGERLPFAVEVLAFGDEEGVRFPVTLTGSRAVAGILDPAALDARDAGGVSVREALQRFGCNPFEIPDMPRRKEGVLGYVEVHIEQGPVLEAEGLPVGVDTAITGASRFIIDVVGVAGHAGTVPMNLRRDALAAAAEMVLAVERTALETLDLVATVGRVEARPGAVNVIPAGARFTIDIRSPSDAVRKAAVARLEQEFREIARRREVEAGLERSYDEAAAVCAPWLIEQLEAAVTRCGVRPLRLPSGAGHDGLAMVTLCPIAMLFVRCEGGISHNPAESITAEDAEVAVRVLLDFLRHLQPQPH
jgi:allantoate deiminase